MLVGRRLADENVSDTGKTPEALLASGVAVWTVLPVAAVAPALVLGSALFSLSAVGPEPVSSPEVAALLLVLLAWGSATLSLRFV